MFILSFYYNGRVMLWQILFIFVLIVINGYFAAAEIALISARKTALRERADGGSKGAETALKLTEDTPRLLATIQIVLTLVGMLASALAALTFEPPLTMWLRSLGVPYLAPVAAVLSVVVVTLIISYITLVLGELVPKQLGIQKANTVASAVARPVTIVASIMRPAVVLLSASTNLLGRLVGITEETRQEQVSEEEIKLMVDEQQGIGAEEKRMISEIFELADTVVREIMVPRVDILFAEDTETVAEAAKRLYARGYSRVPVFHEDHDRIIGILILKDLTLPLTEGKSNESIIDWLHEPVFIPETKDLLSTLNEMQEARIQMVIVVDEYGGTAGIVTMEDILEEITGEIIDETDRELESVREIEPGVWISEGMLDTEDAIELGFPIEESDEYDTLAGWMLEQLGHIPHVGEAVYRDNYRFTVVSMRRRRIARIRVQVREAPPTKERGNDEHLPV